MQNNWISVTESIPERGKDVLLYNRGCFEIGAYSEPNKCFLNCNYSRVSATHWMELPEHPLIPEIIEQF